MNFDFFTHSAANVAFGLIATNCIDTTCADPFCRLRARSWSPLASDAGRVID